MTYKFNRRDGNEVAIISILKQHGHWEPIVRGANDGHFYMRGTCYAVEIKNGNLPRAKRKLTPREKKFKRALEKHGVRLFILIDERDAERLVNFRFDKIRHDEYETDEG